MGALVELDMVLSQTQMAGVASLELEVIPVAPVFCKQYMVSQEEMVTDRGLALEG
eukprot:COSAG06_NODE_65381_length_257_cov_0.651899_1_plen_55_part_00